MKKILKNGILTCLLGMMLACSNEIQLTGGHASVGGTFTDGIEIGLAFPDMQTVSTRSMGAQEPELNELDVFLFVFDGNSLKQTIHIPASQTDWADGDGYDVNNRIKFTAYLPQTDNNAVIHIIALDDSDHGFARKIDEVGYGLEDYVMPQFSVSGDQDAYWQRIELGCPITVGVDNDGDDALEDVEGTEEQVSSKLELVKLIRNFAKITMKVDGGVNNFTLLGWTVVNDLDGGSTTPWFSRTGSSDIIYPDFIQSGGTICSYDDLVGQGYPGVSFAGAKLRHTLDEVIADVGKWNTDDKYVYDRKVVSVNPLYILIKGSVNDHVKYYKISLAHRDETTGIVTEYNVIRNIEYNIKITGVNAEAGYSTPAEAAAGPAFNNISGDVTTRSMLQISDGVDMLLVNFITYVVTQKEQKVDFRFRYLENILESGNNAQNGKVVWGVNQADVIDNAGIGLKTQADDPSAIVTSITGPTDVTDERTGTLWKSIEMSFLEPTNELREQKFTIYTPPQTYHDGTTSVGLSRTINLVLRVPWDFERMRIYPGLWEDDTKFPNWNPGTEGTPDSEGEIYIGPEKSAPLTIFFELPAGLPESMFPLDFTIESDRQNIENAGAGNAVVQNGQSLFPGVTDLRIQYVKTVLWAEYAPNGESSTPASRIIRARFLTTTNIASLTDEGIVTTVKLYNPNFNEASYKFERKKGQNVDDPT